MPEGRSGGRATMRRPGDVAEWLGRGLQSLVQRFESARRLCWHACSKREWESRRSRLTFRRSHDRWEARIACHVGESASSSSTARPASIAIAPARRRRGVREAPLVKDVEDSSAERAARRMPPHPEPGSRRVNTCGVLILIVLQRNADERDAVGERRHDGAQTGVGDHEPRVGEHRPVRHVTADRVRLPVRADRHARAPGPA